MCPSGVKVEAHVVIPIDETSDVELSRVEDDDVICGDDGMAFNSGPFDPLTLSFEFV